MSNIVTLYTLPECERCEEIKKILEESGVIPVIRSMNDPEAVTELRFNGCFEIEAPVIRILDVYFNYEEFMKMFAHCVKRGEINGS